MKLKKMYGVVGFLMLHNEVNGYKVAIRATSDYLFKCRDDLKKMEYKKLEEFDNGKIPPEDIEAISKSNVNIERLEYELETMFYSYKHLFDTAPASIQIATMRIQRLQAEIKHLQDGYPVDTFQNLIEGEDMLVLKKKQVISECERRLVVMHENLKTLENIIAESKRKKN